MTKKQILKQLFLLPKEDIMDISKILKGYEERINKSNKDTLLMRMMFASGYHSTKEFYNKNNITKDNSLATALNYDTKNIETYIKLKKIFDIDNNTFLNILEVLGGSDESWSRNVCQN